jgi:alpha-L-fucosidase
LLREIALWNFVNGEAVKNVRPWIVTNEDNVWFTKSARTNVVYAFLTRMSPWTFGEAKTVTLRSVKATPATRVSVLGQSDEIVEYHPEIKPKTTWRQDEAGLHITAYHAQRLYTNRRWPNPIVLKIVDAEPGAAAPARNAR